MSHIYKNIDDLVIHPLLKSQPRLSEDDLLTWRRDMKICGEDDQKRSVLITGANEIVDGRHWYWCARKLGWRKLRVEVVEDNQVRAVIRGTLLHRRHYTKGQLAYIFAADVDPNAGRNRQLSGLTNGHAAPVANSVRNCGMSAEELADELKTSSRVVQQAIEINQFFSSDKKKRTLTDRDGVTEQNVTFEEFFDPRILLAEDPESPRTRAYGLGAVLAGIKQIISIEQHKDSRPHTGGRPERVDKQLNLFGESLHEMQTKFVYWQKWDEETRTEAVKAIPPVIEKMPDDLLDQFAKAIRSELKRRGK